MGSGFLLRKGIFLCYKLLILLFRWGESCTVIPGKPFSEPFMLFIYRRGRGRCSRESGGAEEDESGQWPSQHRYWRGASWDACLGCVHFLAALRAFTQLPKVGSLGLDILWLRSCLAPFRMRENHLRRIYKVSQFIQGIPS